MHDSLGFIWFTIYLCPWAGPVDVVWPVRSLLYWFCKKKMVSPNMCSLCRNSRHPAKYAEAFSEVFQSFGMHNIGRTRCTKQNACAQNSILHACLQMNHGSSIARRLCVLYITLHVMLAEEWTPYCYVWRCRGSVQDRQQWFNSGLKTNLRGSETQKFYGVHSKTAASGPVGLCPGGYWP